MYKQVHLVKNQSFKEIKKSQEPYLDKIVIGRLDITIYN
jgi:hypothetical protein